MKTIFFAAALLLLVAISRFVSFAGFDPAHYSDILRFYSYGPFRMGIFCLHFVGIVALGFIHLSQPNPKNGAISVAAGLLVLVSLFRHFLPVFIVAVIGDVLVLRWYIADVVEKPRGDS